MPWNVKKSTLLVRQAVSSSRNAIAVNIQPKTYGFGMAGFGAGNLGLEATISVFSQDGECTAF